jgi:D-sedoheptulose 7-phosphate isomerase
MIMNYYQSYSSAVTGALNHVEITTVDGSTVVHGEAIDRLCAMSRSIRDGGRQQIFCGNGASAAFSSHMALDWSKNAGVSSRCFSDVALITAVINDAGADELFAIPLRCHASAGDLLVTVSSSGNSPNIIRALHAARELGLIIVTLSGLKPTNQSRQLGDLNLYVPAKTYGIVECVHQVLLHAWLDAYLGIAEWNQEVEQNMSVSSSLK